MYPCSSEPAQVMPAQQLSPPDPHASPSELHAVSQTLALPSAKGRHSVPGQSASVVQLRRQVSVSKLVPAQSVPSQQLGRFGPQLVPSARQLQNSALAQKPLVPLANGTQQPVSQCSFFVQVGRQPANAGTSDSTQAPRQQSLGEVLVPGVHASPRFLQGFVHASSSAHTRSPVS